MFSGSNGRILYHPPKPDFFHATHIGEANPANVLINYFLQGRRKFDIPYAFGNKI